jgi:hypothetical protein
LEKIKAPHTKKPFRPLVSAVVVILVSNCNKNINSINIQKLDFNWFGEEQNVG